MGDCDVGELLGFGATPYEREAARARAKEAARQLEAAGDWKPRWKSRYPSAAEERRANMLAAKPSCKVCERLFARNVTPPADLVCGDCRRDMRVQGPDDPPPDPSLF